MNVGGAKNEILSMENTSFRIGFENVITKEPLNKYCVVKIMEFYQNQYLCEQHVVMYFIQKATISILKDRKEKGILRYASDNRPFTGYQFEEYPKSFVIKCGFDGATRYINFWQVLNITKLT